MAEIIDEINGNGTASVDTIPLGHYMWMRLKQIGGVPGDFNLDILDWIYETPGLEFVSNGNELNAAYCADGYARVKADEGVPGVFITTHGVGEMSAINGVLASLCERTKSIHIVGQTPRKLQKAKLMVHHSIGNDAWDEEDRPDHQLYARMSKDARVAAAELWDIETAPAEIDRVIRECVVQSGPVYIFLPLDLSMEHVPKSLLSTPIDLSLPRDPEAETLAINAIAEALSSSKRPMLFVDGLVVRYGARPECRELARFLKIPVYASNMGKGIVDETEPYYAGHYMGVTSDQHVINAVDASDCVICLGSCNADTNNGGFTKSFTRDKHIFINPTTVFVRGKRFGNIHIKSLLGNLPSSLSKAVVPKTELPAIPKPVPIAYPDEELEISWIWEPLAKFLQPQDVAVIETGTASFGVFFNRIPANVTVVGLTYYGSIGYATPATLGAEIALRELEKQNGKPKGRVVLITGDGSLQLTMQEVGTMITAGIKPVVIVLNNSGYTIERVIHGARQKYNDINTANYKYMLPFFGHTDPENCYKRVATKKEFGEVFANERLKSPENLMLVELILDPFDAPEKLVKQIAVRSPAHLEYLKSEGFLPKD